MRTASPESFILSFMLPKGVELRPAEIDVAVYGCKIRFERPVVKVFGPGREAVFSCAATVVLRAGGIHPGPRSIAALLKSPPPASGVDSWSIIVGAEVAFSPTAIDPYFPGETLAQAT